MEGPSTEPPSRIGRLLSLGGFPRKLTLSSVGSIEIVLFTGSDAFQALLIVIPDRLLSAGLYPGYDFNRYRKLYCHTRADSRSLRLISCYNIPNTMTLKIERDSDGRRIVIYLSVRLRSEHLDELTAQLTGEQCVWNGSLRVRHELLRICGEKRGSENYLELC